MIDKKGSLEFLYMKYETPETQMMATANRINCGQGTIVAKNFIQQDIGSSLVLFQIAIPKEVQMTVHKKNNSLPNRKRPHIQDISNP